MEAHELQGCGETQAKAELRAGMSDFQPNAEMHIKDWSAAWGRNRYLGEQPGGYY